MSKLNLLDTNAFTIWVDGQHARHAAVVDRAASLGTSYIFISTITIGEVEYGLALPHNLGNDLVTVIRQGLKRFQVLELNRHVGEVYGTLRA